MRVGFKNTLFALFVCWDSGIRCFHSTVWSFIIKCHVNMQCLNAHRIARFMFLSGRHVGREGQTILPARADRMNISDLIREIETASNRVYQCASRPD